MSEDNELCAAKLYNNSQKQLQRNNQQKFKNKFKHSLNSINRNPIKYQKFNLSKTICSLRTISSLTKKQKLTLIQDDQFFIKHLILILGLSLPSQLFLDKNQQYFYQFQEEFKKLLLRMDSININNGQNISGFKLASQFQEEQLIVLLQGTVSLKMIVNNLNQNKNITNIKSQKNISLQPRPISSKKSMREQIQTFIINAEQQLLPPLIDQQFVTKMIALSQVTYLKIPKRAYSNFILWLHNKNSEININFLVRVLELDADDIKSYKLHRKALIRFQKGSYLNLNRKNYGLLLLKNGQLKITYSKHQQLDEDIQKINQKQMNMQYLVKQKQDQLFQKIRQKKTEIILTSGSIIHCLYPTQFRDIFIENQKNKKIQQIKVLKDALIINIDVNTLKQMFQFMPKFKINLQKILKIVALKRQSCIKKQFPQAKFIQYDQSLRKMIFKNKKPFKTCNNLRNRFNSRKIQFNADDQCVNYISNYPYTKFIQSKQKIFKDKILKEEAVKKNFKAVIYLKKNQIKKKQKMQKMLKLRLKNIAQKEIASNQHKQNIFEKQHIKKNIFEQNQIIKEEIISDSFNQTTILAINDTGLIHSCAKKSHIYQKQICNIIKHSQESNSFIRGQRRTASKKAQTPPNANLQIIQNIVNRTSFGVFSQSKQFRQKLLQMYVYHNNFQISKQNQEIESKKPLIKQKMNYKKNHSQSSFHKITLQKSPYYINGFNRFSYQQFQNSCFKVQDKNNQKNTFVKQYFQSKTNDKDQKKILHKANSGKIRMIKYSTNSLRNQKKISQSNNFSIKIINHNKVNQSEIIYKRANSVNVQEIKLREKKVL